MFYHLNNFSCIFAMEVFDCCENVVMFVNAEFGPCWVVNAPVYTQGENVPKQPWKGTESCFSESSRIHNAAGDQAD